MKRLFIKLVTDPKRAPIDFVIPDNLPIKEIIPQIIHAEDIETSGSGNTENFVYWFSLSNGKNLNHNLHPSEAGISNNTTLILKRGKKYPNAVTKPAGESEQNPEKVSVEQMIPKHLSAQDRRGSLRIPNTWREIEINLQLRSKSGKTFTINKRQVVIGRNDPDERIYPDIDLTSLLRAGRERKISRQQAVIENRDGIWYVSLHENAHPLLFIDQEPVLPSESRALSNKAVLAFGKTPTNPEVELVVHITTES